MKVPPLLLLFGLQFLVLSFVVSVVLVKKSLGQRQLIAELNNRISEMNSEVETLRDETQGKDAQLLVLQQMIDDFEEKMQQIQNANAKLKESIALLIPEAERNKEYEKLIDQIEQTNRQLSVCVNSLKYENKNLEKKAKSLKLDLEMMRRKIDSTVDRAEYERVCREKKVTEERLKDLQRQLSEQIKEYEKLSREYQSLEKEYNALYKHQQENNESKDTLETPPAT